MKINDVINSTAAATPVVADSALNQSSVAATASRAASVVNSVSGNSVITSKSDALQSIEATKGSNASFDVDKVAALKAAIDKNDYKIVPGDIADGLILSARDFLATLDATISQANTSS